MSLLNKFKEKYEQLKPILRDRLETDLTNISIKNMNLWKYSNTEGALAMAETWSDTIYCIDEDKDFDENELTYFVLHECGHIYHGRVDKGKIGMFKFVFNIYDFHLFNIVNYSIEVKNREVLVHELSEGFAHYFALEMFDDVYDIMEKPVNPYEHAGGFSYRFFKKVKDYIGHDSVIHLLKNPSTIDFCLMDKLLEDYK